LKNFFNLAAKKILVIPYLANEHVFEYLWEVIQYETEHLKHELIIIDWDQKFEIPEYLSDEASDTRKFFFEALEKRYSTNIRIKVPDLVKKRHEKLDATLFNTLSPETQRSLNSVAATQIFNCENFEIFANKFNKMEPYFYSYKATKQILIREIEIEKPTGVILLNGRWPDQVAILEAAKSYDLSINIVEAGEPTTNRWFYEEFQTTDYARFDQFLYQKYMMRVDADKWFEYAKKWQTQHSTLKSVNKHLKIVPTLKENRNRERKKYASIFTSSIDEYFSNLEFDHRGWGSQERAINKVASRLNEEGYEVVVRLHPNLANKSWVDIVTTFERIRKIKAEIILPWDEFSSYNLIEESDLVITWGSTIGLEALYLGKRVIYLGPTIYESILSESNLNDIDLDRFDFNSVPIISDERISAAIYLSRNWGRIISIGNPIVKFLNSRMRIESRVTILTKTSFYFKKISDIFLRFEQTSPNNLALVLSKVLPRGLLPKTIKLFLYLYIYKKRAKGMIRLKSEIR